jgi:lipoprotein NlpD
MLKITRYLLILVISSLLLSACSFTQKKPATVTDLRNQLAEKKGYHVVQRGETLYFIAWRFGKDFRELAAVNKLQAPYNLKEGQKIYLHGKTIYYNHQPRSTMPTAKEQSAAKIIYQTSNVTVVKTWLMPAKGQIIQAYSSSNKGINIAGTPGEPIRATAAGEVVYAGAGLRAYGNLLIIKHNDIYLSAYAHNQRLLVKEGQTVKAGQEIATMGSSGTNRIMLHFELRKRGKPVNPLKYIH